MVPIKALESSPSLKVYKTQRDNPHTPMLTRRANPAASFTTSFKVGLRLFGGFSDCGRSGVLSMTTTCSLGVLIL